MNNTHQMVLERTHPSGAEEWVCPICNRRLVFGSYQPLKVVTLEVGDLAAAHSGGKGELRMGDLRVTQQSNPFESWALAPDGDE